MSNATSEDKTSGRKHPRKAVYERDPNALDKPPTKPKHLVHGKNFTVRFTKSEWDGILLKATLAGDTPTTIVRAGALGLELRAVLSRVWTDAERVDYRALIEAANNFNKQSKRADLEPHERSQLQKLYAEMLRLLAELVPARIE
jgi:hypothetical protein